MSLPPHELKALAIELAAAMPPLAEAQQTRASASIDLLFNEMDAVIECLQEKMMAKQSLHDRNTALGLAMVLRRLNNELGRTAGVIA